MIDRRGFLAGAVSVLAMPTRAVRAEQRVALEPYAEPRPKRWPTLYAATEDTYTVTPYTVYLPMLFSGPVGHHVPYAVVAESLPMYGCEPDDIIDAEWCQEFTNNNVVGPEKLTECAGVLTLERITDTTDPIIIPKAGPYVDFRCMSENPGFNVANNPQHHLMGTWIGKTRILIAGDYVVRARAYVSPGDFIHPARGSVVTVHDGDLDVTRKRSTHIPMRRGPAGAGPANFWGQP